MDTIRMQLKTLNRQQGLYSKTKTMMKNNLIALLDQTYPGVNALFDSPVREDGSQKWVDFATAFWHVDCVRNMSLTAFAERYRKWCKRHGYNFSQSKAVEVHTGAQDLIAMLPKDALTKTMVRQAIDALNAVSASLERLKAEMQALAAQLPEYPVVMAMHGVGDSLGPQLMAELGDVARFLVRYLPGEKQACDKRHQPPAPIKGTIYRLIVTAQQPGAIYNPIFSRQNRLQQNPVVVRVIFQIGILYDYDVTGGARYSLTHRISLPPVCRQPEIPNAGIRILRLGFLHLPFRIVGGAIVNHPYLFFHSGRKLRAYNLFQNPEDGSGLIISRYYYGEFLY